MPGGKFRSMPWGDGAETVPAGKTDVAVIASRRDQRGSAAEAHCEIESIARPKCTFKICVGVELVGNCPEDWEKCFHCYADLVFGITIVIKKGVEK